MERRNFLTGAGLAPALASAAAQETPLASSGGAPAISSVSVNQTRVPRYDKFEITFDVSGTWSSPFDPDQVSVDGIFQTPGGAVKTVPGFYFQDYQRTHAGGRETLAAIGKPAWKVRFAPTAPGAHRYMLRLTNDGRTVETEWRAFECTPNSNKPGFLRISNENPHYLAFDDGSPFFVVGENIATLGGMGTALADKWYSSLAREGGNFARMWWCSGGTDIESSVGLDKGRGPGRYKLDQAWRIDYILNLAEQLGIYVMACLETQQYLRRGVWWERFSYNVANGGPVTSPADFFVNETADLHFRKRLRYIIARWSYSTALFSWQFWNEVSACNDFNAENASRWHVRMARYLRSIDPNSHVIHSNFGNLDGYQEVDGLPEMELVSTNSYSRRDMGTTAVWSCRMMTSRYRKPYLLTEYGVGHEGRWVENDPKGVIVHDGLWGALVSGAAGAGLPWGWDNWVDAQNMYHYWKPVSELVSGIPFHKRNWRPVTVATLAFRERGRRPYYAGRFFEGWPRNYSYRIGPNPRPTVFQVTPEGQVDHPESFNAVFNSGQSQTLKINAPANATFTVHVPEISLQGASGNPVLRVAVDGVEALRQTLEPVNRDRVWEFWKHYPVPLAAGQREVQISNAGGGSLLTAYELQNYFRREGPDLDVYGMQAEDYVLLWVRNPQFNWIYDREGRKLEEQPEGLLTLSDAPPGAFSVTWWETTTGEVLARRVERTAGGRLTLVAPKITRSAAAKLVRVTA
jgi:hypothetical protein